MPKVEIPNNILENTAEIMVLNMTVQDKSPESLRKVADLIEFWEKYIPEKTKEKLVKKESVK